MSGRLPRRSVTIDASSSPGRLTRKKYQSCHSPRIQKVIPDPDLFLGSTIPELKIKNFTFTDLPQLPDLSLADLESIINSEEEQTTNTLRNKILKKVEYTDDFDSAIDSVGDCNLRLETPLYLAVNGEHLTLSLLLICRNRAEIDFRTISSDSVRNILRNGANGIAIKMERLIKLLQCTLSNDFYQYNFCTKPHGYIIRIDDNKFKIIRQDDEPEHKRFELKLHFAVKPSYTLSFQRFGTWTLVKHTVSLGVARERGKERSYMKPHACWAAYHQLISSTGIVYLDCTTVTLDSCFRQLVSI